MKKLRKTMIPIVLGCLMLVNLFSVCSFAEESNEKRVVRLGVGFSEALYLNESGKLAGYFRLYIRQIEWLENWKLEKECMQAVVSGQQRGLLQYCADGYSHAQNGWF